MRNLLLIVFMSHSPSEMIEAMKHGHAVVSPPSQEVVLSFNAVFLDDREYYFFQKQKKGQKIFTPLRKRAQKTKVSTVLRSRGNVFRNH